RRRASKCTQRTATDGTLEDPRQPAPQSCCSFIVFMAACFVRTISGIAALVVTLCLSRDRVSGLSARDDGSADSSARHPMDQPLLERLGRLPHEHGSDRAVVCFSAAPGVADV